MIFNDFLACFGEAGGAERHPEGFYPSIRGEPPRGPWVVGLRVAGARFGAPEPFQERSKNPSIF